MASGSPSLSFLQVVEGEYVFKGKDHTVFNIPAIKMLFHWLPSLPHPLQMWLSERLYDMCDFGSHNKQRCCVAGVLPTVLKILTNSQVEGHVFQVNVESKDTIVMYTFTSTIYNQVPFTIYNQVPVSNKYLLR